MQTDYLPTHRPGLCRRLGALLYDGILLLGILFLATAILLPFRGGRAFQTDDWGYGIYLLGVVFLFFGWFWTRDGQTLGMRAWKIRLTNHSGKNHFMAAGFTPFSPHPALLGPVQRHGKPLARTGKMDRAWHTRVVFAGFWLGFAGSGKALLA